MSETINYAIVGCGGIARAHLAAVADVPELNPIATCDIARDRAEAFADEYGAAKVYTDYEQLAADPDVQAVSICLPHHLHRAPTVACARGGKHVLCEKPMETALADADAMIAAAQDAGTVLMIGQVLRFRNANRKAKQLIADGAVGKPMNILRRRYGLLKEYARAPWSADPQVAGGWVLYGYGSHEVDAILWLLDAGADTVFAQANMNNPHWCDYDEIAIQMRLSNGAIATQQHTVNCPFGAWDCIVIGDEGAMRIDNGSVTVGDEQIDAPLQKDGGMREQLEEFACAISQGREPQASGANVRRTMVALEAAKLSIQTGQVVDAQAM